MVVQTGKKGEVTFVWDKEPQAKKVYLAGSFNDWDPQAKRMTRCKDRTFRARLRLSTGQYEYKFIVDGEWIDDPDADYHIQNQYGSVNSVINVG